MDRRLNESRPTGSTARAGLLYGVLAYLLWGSFPGYFPLLRPASALEVLAHRVVWSLVVMLVVVVVTHRGAAVRAVLRNRRQLVWLSVGAAFIAVNWGVYIWGVFEHRVVETSLGYFINPLVTILLGVVVLGERLRPLQWVAVAIASAAIVVLTVGYGTLPWIALVLAFSFGTYGLAKKQADVDAVESLTVETLVLTPFAVATLVVMACLGRSTFTTDGFGHSALLASAGLVTCVPLLCFGAAAKRLPLSTVGLLQYLTPVLQFLYGVVIDGERLSTLRLVGFGLVWIALVVLVVEGLTRSRRTRHRRPPAALDPVDTAV
ncbi:EamA family transporter RarD [Jatrophihabitans sp. YIM 134969]